MGGGGRAFWEAEEVFRRVANMLPSPGKDRNPSCRQKSLAFWWAIAEGQLQSSQDKSLLGHAQPWIQWKLLRAECGGGRMDPSTHSSEETG